MAPTIRTAISSVWTSKGVGNLNCSVQTANWAKLVTWEGPPHVHTWGMCTSSADICGSSAARLSVKHSPRLIPHPYTLDTCVTGKLLSLSVFPFPFLSICFMEGAVLYWDSSQEWNWIVFLVLHVMPIPLNSGRMWKGEIEKVVRSMECYLYMEWLNRWYLEKRFLWKNILWTIKSQQHRGDGLGWTVYYLFRYSDQIKRSR